MWYILVSDDSGHTYVIPENKDKDFQLWVDSGEPDEPDYADRVEGSFRFKGYIV